MTDSKEMAEREGFEPPVPVKVRLISSQVHSTGLCHLSVLSSIAYSTILPPLEAMVRVVTSVGDFHSTVNCVQSAWLGRTCMSVSMQIHPSYS